jgi:hypothetical protein
MDYNFKDLKNQIDNSVKEHKSNQDLDAWLYNTSIVMAVLCSSIASLLISSCPTAAKILTLSAAALVAIDRALNWGARWVYHRNMRHEYLLILARISLVENAEGHFTEEEKKKYFLLIFDDLFTLRKKESLIPGVTDVKAKS